MVLVIHRITIKHRCSNSSVFFFIKDRGVQLFPPLWSTFLNRWNNKLKVGPWEAEGFNEMWLRVFFFYQQSFSHIAVFYTPDLSGRIMVWRGRLSVRLSVWASVCKTCKHDRELETEPFQLGPSNLVHILLITRVRTLSIFKVRGQKVKVTPYT